MRVYKLDIIVFFCFVDSDYQYPMVKLEFMLTNRFVDWCVIDNDELIFVSLALSRRQQFVLSFAR